jgi:hypothetical protein
MSLALLQVNLLRTRERTFLWRPQPHDRAGNPTCQGDSAPHARGKTGLTDEEIAFYDALVEDEVDFGPLHTSWANIKRDVSMGAAPFITLPMR